MKTLTIKIRKRIGGLRSGFSLVEVLIGLTLLGVIMATVNVLLFTSLRGARKAEAVGVTKSEGAYALNAMAQVVRYAVDISCVSGTRLDVTRPDGEQLTYRLDTLPAVDTIASESGGRRVELLSDRVTADVMGCAGGAMFTCAADNRWVDMCFYASRTGGIDVSDSERINFSTRVTLRNWGI